MMRRSLVLVMVAVASAFSVVSRAEPPKAGRSPGINPLVAEKATPAPPPPKVGTTTTTAATLLGTGPANGESPEEREVVRPNRSLLITGGAILVGSYAVSATAAAFSDTDADKRLYVPLVGPWLDLGQRECGLGQCGLREDVNILQIVGSGAAQATGLVLAVTSLFVDQKKSGRPAPQRPAPEPRTMQIVPVPGGIGAVGTF